MKPTLKLKIKLPPGAATSLPSSPALPKKMSLPTPTATLNKALTPGVISTTPTGRPRMINTSLKKRKLGTPASAQPPGDLLLPVLF